jgi:enterochelin esterase-like enzyme
MATLALTLTAARGMPRPRLLLGSGAVSGDPSTPKPPSSYGEPAQAVPAQTQIPYAQTGCSGEGEIIQTKLDDDTLERPLPYRIYLPPCYPEPGKQYPSLYLLHGLGADDSQWVSLGIKDAADALIASDMLPPVIIVMPWHRTGLDLEAALVEALVPEIDQNYSTVASAYMRGIGGLSRGGGEALGIALRHPDLFLQVGLHSPANLFTRAQIRAWVNAFAETQRPRIWLDIGSKDPLRGTALDLAAWLRAQHIPLLVRLPAGGHDAAYWSAHLFEYLRWYGSGFWILMEQEHQGTHFPLRR